MYFSIVGSGVGGLDGSFAIQPFFFFGGVADKEADLLTLKIVSKSRDSSSDGGILECRFRGN